MSRSYSATKLGQFIGVAGSEVNVMLEEMGFHERQSIKTDVGRVRHRWVITALGEPHSKIMKGDKNGGAYELTLWDQHVADLLGAHRPPSRKEHDALIALVAALQAQVDLHHARLGL